MPHVLVVDDEPGLVKGLRLSLEQEGFQITTASDGQQALDKIKVGVFDLIVLDLMLPEVDGLTVCRQIRMAGMTPIIMLTAKADDIDKVLGLELGADDYLTKPFNTRELIARIRAILRRSEAPSREEASRVKVGGLVLYVPQRRAEVEGRSLDLTAREFDLLEILARHPGVVYTRQQLLDLVWGYEFAGDDRTVDVHVRRIREKVEEIPSRPRHLRTKWGVGYFLEPEA